MGAGLTSLSILSPLVLAIVAAIFVAAFVVAVAILAAIVVEVFAAVSKALDSLAVAPSTASDCEYLLYPAVNCCVLDLALCQNDATDCWAFSKASFSCSLA